MSYYNELIYILLFAMFSYYVILFEYVNMVNKLVIIISTKHTV